MVGREKALRGRSYELKSISLNSFSKPTSCSYCFRRLALDFEFWLAPKKFWGFYLQPPLFLLNDLTLCEVWVTSRGPTTSLSSFWPWRPLCKYLAAGSDKLERCRNWLTSSWSLTSRCQQSASAVNDLEIGKSCSCRTILLIFWHYLHLRFVLPVF